MANFQYNGMLLILSGLWWRLYEATASIGVQEYCLRTNSEYFEAKCHKNEVIVMTIAIYGRMRMGKCLEEERKYLPTLGNDPNFLGCSVDILPFMDQRCSGRNRCEIRGADEDLQKQNPCHVLFKSYLEATYQCAQVVEEDRTCTVSVTSSAQHLMTSHSASTELSCGSRHQPWKLEAPAGQQINVSLLDFSIGTVSDLSRCQSLGYILETSSSKNVTVCSLSGKRFSHIFTSQSTSAQIFLSKELDLAHSGRAAYLIQFIAIGCSNVLPPVDAWLRRDGNTAVVGCYTSRQSWTLRCVDNHWIGVIGNCTRDKHVEENLESLATNIEKKTTKLASMEVVVIITIVVTGLSIVLCLICAGVVLWKRYTYQYTKHATKLDQQRSVDRCKGYYPQNQLLVETT